MVGDDVVALGCIYDIDYVIGSSINKFLNFSNGALSPLFKFITYLGNGGAIFIAISICLLLFKKTRKVGIILLFSLLLGVIITNLLLKNIIARPRPFINEQSDFYIWWKQAGSLIDSGYSFPSGHTTAAMAFGFTLFLCLKKKTSWLYLFIPLIMGFTRIYFMVHYASDVFGALLVGVICSLIAYFVMKYIAKFPFIQKVLNYPSITNIFKKKDKSE